MGERALLGVATVRLLALGTALLVGLGVGPAQAQARTLPGPLRFEAPEGGWLELGDGRRFLDTVELRRTDAGTVLINALSMDDYVAGVAEVPTRWPMEALKAQAVAARTYAWYSIRLGTFDDRGYDICATVACQVFHGADVVLDDDGARWQQAVDETAGEVLVDPDGAPILARYFSTSGGRTYANEDVFGSPAPYLVGIEEDPFDAVSPYHRWTATFTREEFDELVGRGDTLGAAAPVADVRREGSLHDPEASIVVTGRDGTERSTSARAFREFVSRVAPTIDPSRFPGRRADGLRPLPDTLPSSRYELEVTEDEVTVRGRGWGHGVGMGQYGALGRAQEGHTYREILAAYYDGLEPTADADVPGRVRVGLDLADRTSVRGSGPVRVLAGDEVVEERALGAWQVVREGDGWRLAAPEGHDEELSVTPTRPAADLADLRDAVVVEADVNKPVLLRLQVAGADGDDVVLVRELGAADPGTHAATWRFDDADGAPVAPGDYAVTLVAEDADGAVAGEPHVVSTPTDDPVGSAPDAAGDRRTTPFVAVGAALVGAALATLLIRARRSSRP